MATTVPVSVLAAFKSGVKSTRMKRFAEPRSTPSLNTPFSVDPPAAPTGGGTVRHALSALAGLRRRAESAGTTETSAARATNQTAKDMSSRANSTGIRMAVVATSDADMSRAAP